MKKNLFYKIGILLIIVSGLILFSSKVIVIKKNISENRKINNLITGDNKKNINYEDDYIAVLEIPKINLRKGLVDINNINNNVDKNVQIISSDISRIDSSNIILAAHSGSGYKAFFKNLHKLELGDIASIYYDGKKYNYFVDNIYLEIKDGDIEISNYSNSLILTTCYGKDKQLVVILKQRDYENFS